MFLKQKQNQSKITIQGDFFITYHLLFKKNYYLTIFENISSI